MGRIAVLGVVLCDKKGFARQDARSKIGGIGWVQGYDQGL